MDEIVSEFNCTSLANWTEVLEGGYAYTTDEKTNYSTYGISYCTAIAIITEDEGRIGRYLAHRSPHVCDKYDVIFPSVKNFLLQPNTTVKKAQIVSSMGYPNYPSLDDEVDKQVIEKLKRFFDEAKLCQHFTFDFRRASEVKVLASGQINICSHEDTLEHIENIYHGDEGKIYNGRITLEFRPSFQIM